MWVSMHKLGFMWFRFKLPPGPNGRSTQAFLLACMRYGAEDEVGMVGFESHQHQTSKRE